jgi:prevent-host-death family protein
MKTTSVAEVKARLSAYIHACEEGPVIITRNGKPAAVLLAVQDEDELERLVLAYSPKFHAILEAARQQIQETGGVRHDEFWQEAEEDPA